MKVTITSPFSTATPESAMKPTAAEIENGMPRSQSATMPPVSASGTPREHQHRVARPRRTSRRAAGRSATKQTGTTNASRCFASTRFSNCPPQTSQLPGGSSTSRGDPLLRLGDERADVAAADVRLDDDAALAVLAADLVRALGDVDRCDGAERKEAEPEGAAPVDRRRARRRATPRPRVAAAGSAGCSSASRSRRNVFGQAHDDVEAPVALEELSRLAAADRDRRRPPARRRRSAP